MKDNFYNEETLRKFLLEDVSEGLRNAIEDRFLEDEDFMAQLLVVEDELIEDYLRGSVSSREKELFEKAFLANPRRRERVLAMKSIIAVANAEVASIVPQTVKEESSSLWSSVFAFLRFEKPLARYAFAAVALLIALGALFLISRRFNQNQNNIIANVAQPTPSPYVKGEIPTPSPAFSPTPNIEPSPQPSSTPKTESSEPTLATVILRPALLRAPNSATKLTLASSVKQVRIQLSLERNDYKSYVVRITTVEGRSVWQGGPLYTTKSGKAIVINLPTKILPSDDYIIELSGVSEAGPIESFADFFFSVTRK